MTKKPMTVDSVLRCDRCGGSLLGVPAIVTWQLDVDTMTVTKLALAHKGVTCDPAFSHWDDLNALADPAAALAWLAEWTDGYGWSGDDLARLVHIACAASTAPD
jgi:hypothetical protein